MKRSPTLLLLKLSILGLIFIFSVIIDGTDYIPYVDNNINRYDRLLSEGRYRQLYLELKRCEFKDVVCTQMLGDAYFTGMYVEQDLVMAISYWKVSSDSGSPEGQFSLGMAYTLFPLLDSLECVTSAESNDQSGTAYSIKEFIENSLPVPCDLYPYSIEDAPLFLEKYKSMITRRLSRPRDENEDLLLQQNLTQSIQLSNMYLYFSSLSGHAGAQLALGFRYEHGLGVQKSCDAAVSNYMETVKSTISLKKEGFSEKEQLVRLSIPNWEPLKKLFSQKENRNREDLAVNLAESGNITIQLALAKRYLLGMDGFQQDPAKAYKYLRKIADKAKTMVGLVLDIPSTLIFGEAIGLLGYMHALGIGTAPDLKIAAEYFSISAFIYNDPGGHNGMGYVYFHGCPGFERNFRLSFHHFNESAFHLFADAQYNLASLYLTGMGTSQSFSDAISWYSRAYEQGHLPSALALSQLNLNGLGTNRDCNVALGFLKGILHRSSWATGLISTTNRLSRSKDEAEENMAMLSTIKLAMTGYDPSLSNLAILLEKDLKRNRHFSRMSSKMGLPLSDFSTEQHDLESWFRSLSAKVIPRFLLNLFPDLENMDTKTDHLQSEPGNQWYLPQMFLELSIYKDNVDSILKYGDYSYYGKGVELRYRLAPLGPGGSLSSSPLWVRPLEPEITPNCLQHPGHLQVDDLTHLGGLLQHCIHDSIRNRHQSRSSPCGEILQKDGRDRKHPQSQQWCRRSSDHLDANPQEYRLVYWIHQKSLLPGPHGQHPLPHHPQTGPSSAIPPHPQTTRLYIHQVDPDLSLRPRARAVSSCLNPTINPLSSSSYSYSPYTTPSTIHTPQYALLLDK
ncbi:putative Sel1 protein [Cryptosporidium canis]|nr:putative Sel1 protein [Cryptosporidium canis]